MLGHSRGGGLALVHAAERGDLRCIVTWAAVATFDRFDAPSKQSWRSLGFLPVLNARTGQELRLGVSALDDLEQHRDRFDVPAACRRVRAPVLLVHGTADESVAFSESQRLLESLPAERARLLAIEGAGHTFGVRHPMRGSHESGGDAWEKVARATVETILRFG